MFAFDRLTPLHITLKVDLAVRTLRRRDAYRVFRIAMTRMLDRDDFRIVHLSLEYDHVHLLVEATSHTALARGMKAFESSAGQRLNQHADRTGRVFLRNYYARVIKNPTMAHRALTYVLNNWRKHGEHKNPSCANWNVDYFSTAPSFTGWQTPPDPDGSHDFGWEYERLPSAEPRHFFLRAGWRRVGTLAVEMIPSA